MFGNHSKKRPNNLVMGRCFDHHILDMMEFGVENYQSMAAFKKAVTLGAKPCFVFSGDVFETSGACLLRFLLLRPTVVCVTSLLSVWKRFANPCAKVREPSTWAAERCGAFPPKFGTALSLSIRFEGGGRPHCADITVVAVWLESTGPASGLSLIHI